LQYFLLKKISCEIKGTIFGIQLQLYKRFGPAMWNKIQGTLKLLGVNSIKTELINIVPEVCTEQQDFMEVRFMAKYNVSKQF